MRQSMQAKRPFAASSRAPGAVGHHGQHPGQPAPGGRLSDVPEQILWLSEWARVLGYAGIDELFRQNPRQFDELARYWRASRERRCLH